MDVSRISGGVKDGELLFYGLRSVCWVTVRVLSDLTTPWVDEESHGIIFFFL